MDCIGVAVSRLDPGFGGHRETDTWSSTDTQPCELVAYTHDRDAEHDYGNYRTRSRVWELEMSGHRQMATASGFLASHVRFSDTPCVDSDEY